MRVLGFLLASRIREKIKSRELVVRKDLSQDFESFLNPMSTSPFFIQLLVDEGGEVFGGLSVVKDGKVGRVKEFWNFDTNAMFWEEKSTSVRDSFSRLLEAEGLDKLIGIAKSEDHREWFEKLEWSLANAYRNLIIEGNEMKAFFDKIDPKVEAGDKNFEEGWSLKIFSRVPQECLEDFVKLFNELLSEMPSAIATPVDHVVTIEDHLRFERSLEEKKIEYRVVLAFDSKNELIGMSNLSVNLNNQSARQFMTGVHSNYRGYGLGLLMKGKLLAEVNQENLKVDKITTSVSKFNSPMLNINKEIGFKQFNEEWVFELKNN